MHAVQDETRSAHRAAEAVDAAVADTAEEVLVEEVSEAAVDDVAEEVLVEEVSIDGMCGVY
ncbi:mycofactocin precursor MftA [Streptomyces sp. DASNCL29]|uniref:mycofactocin precursor MftA n=1 Tax=Streptomyces sp. DASNCL29 TaxID=2583819 RepID=UPI00110FE2A1|nr:mycofactocin precursor MftA [Streptomyces sp. DASNCL29]TMU90385.1 mycofactocin precursor [Streptomyces sp. DASNCL29]